MIKKGDQTRADILKCARKIFSQKGYNATTMKDLCEETGLSRGGLYRHFSSTKEIMIEMLDSDIVNTRLELHQVISSNLSAKQFLTRFLDAQKEDIKKKGGDLELAIYEFCKTEKDQEHYISNRFITSVEIIEELIQYGQGKKEFTTYSANETAKRIVLLLEGIKLASSIMIFDDELLDQQIQGVYQMVVGV